VNAREAVADGTRFLGLSAKITIIVFWGTVALGAVGSYFILDTVESQVRARHQYEAQYLAGRLEAALDNNASFTETQLPAPLMARLSAALRETETVRGVRLTLPQRTLDLGTPQGEPALTQRLTVHARALGRHVDVGLAVYQTDIGETLMTRRKQVLAGLGVSLLFFGVFLQLLLRALLTRPFERMTRVVRAYQAGDESIRFDESRRDEFGYVAGFFNAALDSVAERRRREVQTALNRADASETALRLEREHAAITLDAIGDAVLRMNRHGRITYTNPAAESLLAMPVDRKSVV
jgi:PAS domain-containing protein